MARLNEVEASTENIESLKRKFMRQNRDIARANSSQSLRIRSLENEVSRLLSENLGLRGQILRLEHELESGIAQRNSEHTSLVKIQLEAKLQEIGALLNGLGHAPTPKKKSPRAGKTTRASPNTSPDQKNWRNIFSSSEAMADQEGRLPPILENKSYPRRTLERQELSEIISAAEPEVEPTDSPEIGPPPVSQFVDESPVKIDLPHRSHIKDPEEMSIIDPILAMNLEQRKKRRESGGPTEAIRTTKFEQAEEYEERKASLKLGAKRKLGVREDEDPQTVIRHGENTPDNFKYTRVVTEERSKSRVAEKPAGMITRELAVARGVSRERRASTTTAEAATATSRKALAPKSVNESPRKNVRGSIKDETKAAKADVPRLTHKKGAPKEKKLNSVLINSQLELLSNTVEVYNEPETLAALDILPPATQPSATRVESRDTPPPPEHAEGAEGLRPSRRARGAVSYAEPNLRDKMRRPTKELVDAVVRDGNQQREKRDGETSTTAIIKGEPQEEDAWKHMPLASTATVENSPLRGKATEPDLLPNSIITHRKRRDSILTQGQVDLSKSGSESAISALLAEHRKAKSEVRQRALGKDVSSLNQALGKLDIYDVKSSLTESSMAKSTREDPSSKPERRVSSASRDIIATDDGEASDMDAPKKTGVLISRRRQSALGVRSTSANTENVTKKNDQTTNTVDVDAKDARGDRISARRRSMML